MRTFLGAAGLGEENGWPLDVAVARELAARTMIEAGDTNSGHERLRQASAAYDRYGASVKVSAIARELGDASFTRRTLRGRETSLPVSPADGEGRVGKTQRYTSRGSPASSPLRAPRGTVGRR